MIVVDPRIGSGKGATDLVPYLQRLKATVEKAHLDFGDAACEGNGPSGHILIGFERKTLSDMLNCIDDARFAGFQNVGMKQLYQVRVLIVEGVWRADFKTGYLMECIGALRWVPFRFRAQFTRYSKLFRFLLSVQLSGVVVIQTRDIEETAYNIYEMQQYFNKKWDDHTSLLEVQKLAIPAMNARPSLVRRWASDLTDVGVKYSMEAEKLFKSPIALAKADESAWLRIKGVGVKTAQQIVREIQGWKV